MEGVKLLCVLIRGPCADFQLGLRISANSVANINTAKSLQKIRKQFACKRKRSPILDPGIYLDCITKHIHLLFIYSFVADFLLLLGSSSESELESFLFFFADFFFSDSDSKKIQCDFIKNTNGSYT